MPTSPDDPSIPPWGPRQPIDHRRLNALQERVITDLTVGPGLKLLRKGNQVSIMLIEQPVRPATSGAVVVAITGALTPGGLYSGYVVALSGADLDPASAATSSFALIGVTPGESVYFLNLPEYVTGVTTHDLTAVTNAAGRYGVGAFAPSVTWLDGKRTVAGISLPFFTCTPPP